uniref:DUF6030 family protein n=1 Tax=Stappia sp. TaxID=1870903 RepID=UPI003BA9CC57
MTGRHPQAGPGAQALSGIARRQRRRGLALRAGLGVLALAGAAVLFALIEGGGPRGPIAPAPPALPADPLAGVPQPLVARITSPGIDLPASFKRVYGGKPAALCEAIDGLGVPMSDWKPDPFVAGAWYCASDLVAIGREDEAGRRSTLFVNLRGQSAETLNTVRIKLNGDNPQTVAAARAALGRILDAVGERYGWPWPVALRTAIAEARAVEVEAFGLALKVLPEDASLQGDAPGTVRLNVILDFPAVDLAAPAEIFAPFSWEEPKRRTRRRSGDRVRGGN